MNNITTKTKLVFIPLLLIAIGFIVFYCLLYWLVWIKLEIMPLKKNIIEFWIPIGLAFVCLLLFIRPRLHLLKLDYNDGKIRILYYLVGAAVLCVPAMIGIAYLDTATGKLTVLDSITELAKKPKTKYYSAHSFVLNKDFIGIESVSSYSGKNNQHLDFDIYIALPFTRDLYDTLNSPTAFLSRKYHKQISSKIKDEDREKQWNNFWDESFESLEKDRISFTYLERTDNTEERQKLTTAARNSALYKTGSPIVILKPIDEAYYQRNGNKLQNVFLSFGIGLLLWFIMINIPGLHEDKVKRFKPDNRKNISTQFQEVYDLVKLQPGFRATPILLIINTAVFVIMVLAGLGFINFYNDDLINWGALNEPLVNKGEWWRILSSMFLHGGVMHLFMNMLSLYLAGIFLESFIGTKRFAIGYVISGIIAAFISMWWHDKPVVAVGASGAIFGLYGMLLSLVISKVFDSSVNKVLLILLASTAGYSLLMGALSEGIDNSAHLGGLSAGLVIGHFYANRIKQSETTQVANPIA
jgi:membrane associated rhomboid family serine protease